MPVGNFLQDSRGNINGKPVKPDRKVVKTDLPGLFGANIPQERKVIGQVLLRDAKFER